MHIVLSIAGSDPSAGAGIQQDLKTITALGSYGVTVITALTAQSTQGVSQVYPVPGAVVSQQLQTLLADVHPHAIKIGQLPNREVAQAVVEHLQTYLNQYPVPVVYDPVMVATSGRRLMAADCTEYIVRHLLPLCTLVTPNLPEAEVLRQYQADVPTPHTALLLKGGHAQGPDATDVLQLADGTTHRYQSPRIDSPNLHGTGCTLSSAIATHLAQGQPLPQAVALGKQTLVRGIKGGQTLHIGQGNGPLWLG